MAGFFVLAHRTEGVAALMDLLHRIFSSQTITPFELRLAGALALEWWLMDHIWFLGTVFWWW